MLIIYLFTIYKSENLLRVNYRYSSSIGSKRWTQFDLIRINIVSVSSNFDLTSFWQTPLSFCCKPHLFDTKRKWPDTGVGYITLTNMYYDYWLTENCINICDQTYWNRPVVRKGHLHNKNNERSWEKKKKYVRNFDS